LLDFYAKFKQFYDHMISLTTKKQSWCNIYEKNVVFHAFAKLLSMTVIFLFFPFRTINVTNFRQAGLMKT
jgi:hypothetical protein